MKNISTLLIFALMLNLTSCIDFKTKKPADEPSVENFNTVTINDDYQVSIPKFMRAATGLNDQASLQYQNIFKETYVIVIDEPKSGFVDVLKDMGQYDEDQSLVQNYREVQLQLLASTMNFNHQSEPKSLKINGLDAEMVEIDARVDGIKEGISYVLTFFDGTDNAYMMMAWTLQDQKDEHKKTFETIAKSFQLVD
jgi:bifunctional DNA-binding transcriptional regulator/antitoxin component of YhaV-PrlF toxin-antitoxin module